MDVAGLLGAVQPFGQQNSIFMLVYLGGLRVRFPGFAIDQYTVGGQGNEGTFKQPGKMFFFF